jgi:hypothetical protein
MQNLKLPDESFAQERNRPYWLILLSKTHPRPQDSNDGCIQIVFCYSLDSHAVDSGRLFLFFSYTPVYTQLFFS